MYQIVYISSATVPVTEQELESFLERWRRNNERNGVTGMLLYSTTERRFMQIIEGDKAVIMALFAKIQVDIRHRDLLKLADGPILERSFSSWLMGFEVVTLASFKQLAGYIEPDSPAFQQALRAAPDALIRELLASFFLESPQGV